MEKIKSSRKLSFITILIVYIIAAVCGVLIYNALPWAMWKNLLIADIAATIVVFIFSVIFKNASVYDPYWSVQPPVILTMYAVSVPMNELRVLMLIAVWFWGIRLTANWAYTFRNLNSQDWRYTMLHEKTGIFYPIINFLGIHLVPTLVVYGCMMPAIIAMQTELETNVGSAIFFFVSIGAVVLQGTSDYQMHRFRKNRTSPFIRTGLWKYSRHPNYLGEICMWWGIALSLVSADTSYWYMIAGAVCNTLLFRLVSIPMADGRQSRKAGFAEYKAATRMLFPIKKESEEMSEGRFSN